VHGDYRLDNTMLSNDDAGRIVAVLDWEMATLGDPLADLGLFLLYWGRPEAQMVATSVAIDPAKGFLSRDEVAERYAATSGRSLDDLEFYEVLAMYKLAIIIEGIHARYLMGKTLGDGFDHVGGIVEHLAHGAVEFASASSVPELRG
jgi:aminoglycoside phosphotransferase (APT) family kinase protein